MGTLSRGVGTTYGYGAAGDLLSVEYSDATPDVTYTYDRQGRRATATDASGTRTFTYDDDGNQTGESYAGGVLDGASVAWGYDALGRRTSLAAAHGQTSLGSAGYGYDAAGRLNTVTGGDLTFTYTYQPMSGLVTSVTANNGTAEVLTTTKTYDRLDHLVSISYVNSVPSVVTSHTYDYNDANQRIRATLTDGTYWEYQYDELGQVISGCKYWPDATPVGGMQFGYAFDDIGNREAATTNGRESVYTSNALNQYEQRTVPGAVDVLGSADPDAVVTVTLDNDGATSILPVNRRGSYFWKELTADNQTAAKMLGITVTGVRPGAGPNGEDVVAESAGQQFLAKTPEPFAYDADGNLLSGGRWSYAWDAENRLTRVEDSTRRLAYAYDETGRRIAATTWEKSPGGLETLLETRRFVYDGWNLVCEYLPGDPSTTIKATYTWGLDLSGSLQGAGGVGGLLCATTCASEPTCHVPCYDGNGNVTAYVNAASGAKSATFEYSPFGEAIAAAGAATEGMPFRLSTKHTNPETGLIYYGWRYCAPTLGRWMSKDPIEENGGWNLLLAWNNGPPNVIDADGRAPIALPSLFPAPTLPPPILASLRGRQFQVARQGLRALCPPVPYHSWAGRPITPALCRQQADELAALAADTVQQVLWDHWKQHGVLPPPGFVGNISSGVFGGPGIQCWQWAEKLWDPLSLRISGYRECAGMGITKVTNAHWWVWWPVKRFWHNWVELRGPEPAFLFVLDPWPSGGQDITDSAFVSYEGGQRTSRYVPSY